MVVMEMIVYMGHMIGQVMLILFKFMVLPLISLGSILLWTIVMFNGLIMAKKFIQQDVSARNSASNIANKKYNKLKNQK